MEARKFFNTLSVLTGATIVFVALLGVTVDKISEHSLFSYITIALFVGICLAAYFLGTKAVLSQNKYRFIHVLVMIIMGKMFLSLAIIVIYMKLVEPTNKTFVLPFLLIYLIYTAFEVYFLEKVARADEKPTVRRDH